MHSVFPLLLRGICQTRNITKAELAQILRVDADLLYRWARGAHKPQFRSFLRVCASFSIRPDLALLDPEAAARQGDLGVDRMSVYQVQMRESRKFYDNFGLEKAVADLVKRDGEGYRSIKEFARALGLPESHLYHHHNEHLKRLAAIYKVRRRQDLQAETAKRREQAAELIRKIVSIYGGINRRKFCFESIEVGLCKRPSAAKRLYASIPVNEIVHEVLTPHEPLQRALPFDTEK